MREENKESIIAEHGSSATDWVYEAVSGFYLTTCEGPPKAIQPGEFVRLKAETGRMLFWTQKVMPHDPGVPDLAWYRVLIPFTVVGEDGKWLEAKHDDKVEFDKTEAIKWIREGNIMPLDSSIFWPWELGKTEIAGGKLKWISK